MASPVTSSKHVYIVDDDTIDWSESCIFLGFRGFIAHLYTNDQALLAGVGHISPGCVLLEIDGVETGRFRLIHALSSHRERLPIVVMARSGDVATAVAAMKAGAVDVIEKPIVNAALVGCVGDVLHSLEGQVLAHDRRVSASERLAALTARENDVLRGLSVGRSNKLLAFDFGISIRTVEMHRSSMMERLGVRTLAEALFIAFDAWAGTTARRAA